MFNQNTKNPTWTRSRVYFKRKFRNPKSWDSRVVGKTFEKERYRRNGETLSKTRSNIWYCQSIDKQALFSFMSFPLFNILSCIYGYRGQATVWQNRINISQKVLL